MNSKIGYVLTGSMVLMLGFLLGACAAPDPNAGKKSYTIEFDAVLGDKPLRCGETYQGVGKTNAKVMLQALQMYVHDVHLLRSGGEKVHLELTADNQWQRDGVALLNFMENKGECKTDSPSLNMKIVGLAPEHSDYSGVSFKMGMPADKNHIDAAVAPPPFNNSGMWWTWKGGYKYIRLDVKTDTHLSWYLHLGSSDCTGTLGVDYKCNKGNLVDVQLLNFKPGTNKVVFNASVLYADIDLNAPIDPKKDENKDGKPDDTLPGCMVENDPECQMLFQKLGLSWGQLTKTQQTVFLVK